MPVGNWNLQWLNHNSQRSYPLAERATKVDNGTPATIRLPDSFIVAMYLPIHAGLSISTNNFYLKTLLISPSGYNVVVGYDDGDEYPDVAVVNIPKSGYTPNRAYAMAGVGDFVDTVGQIVIGNLDEIDTLPPGLYSFDPEGGYLESDVIRPMIRGITRLRVQNGLEVSEPVYGDVTFVAGTNMRLGIENQVGQDPVITFSAISGENLNVDCVCAVPSDAKCIKCINGVCSDDGNFTLGAGDCIEITEVPGGLKFADICAQPCCGCEELNALTNQIDRFGDGVTTLQNFVTRLSSEVTQMSLVVLGSKLGDSGCSTC